MAAREGGGSVRGVSDEPRHGEAYHLAAIKKAINNDGRARVARNSVGFDAERRVRYGLGVGSPDLVGILRGSGRVFCLEVKSDRGRASEEQLAWARAVRRLGGFAAVVRSEAEAMAALERAIAGASE